MPLTLLAGPANSGKVAPLLDRYLDSLDEDPVLIVPNRPDVDRIERDLLERSPALLGGLDRHLRRPVRAARALGDARARPVATEAQRALVVRRVLAARAAERTGALGALPRASPSRSLSTLGELEAGLLEPGRSRRRDLAALYSAYRAELDRLGLVGPRYERRHAAGRSPATSTPGTARPVFAYGFEDLTGARVGAARGLAARTERHRLAAVRARTRRPSPRSSAPRPTSPHSAAAAIEELPPGSAGWTQPGARASRARALRRTRRPSRRRSPVSCASSRAPGSRVTHELVGEEILGLLRAGSRAEEIAVVCPTLDRVRAPLETAFSTLGIPFAVEGQPAPLADAVRPGALRAAPLRRGSRAAARTCTGSSARRTRAWPARMSTTSRAACADARSRTRSASRRRRSSSAASRSRSSTSARARSRSQPPATLARIDAARRLRARRAAARRARAARPAHLRGRARGCSTSSRTGSALGEHLSREEILAALERATVRGSRRERAGTRRTSSTCMRARTRRYEIVFVLGLEEGSLPRRSQAAPFLDDQARAEHRPAQARCAARPPGPGLRASAISSTPRARARAGASTSSARPRPTTAPRARPSPFWDEVRALWPADDVERWTTRRRLSSLTWQLERAPTERERLRALARACRVRRARSADALARANGWERRLDRRPARFRPPDSRSRHPPVLDELARDGHVRRHRARGVRGLLLDLVLRADGRPAHDRRPGRTRAYAARSRTRRCTSSSPACRRQLGTDRVEPERLDDAIAFLHQCLDEALECGVRLELTDVERSELEQGAAARPRALRPRGREPRPHVRPAPLRGRRSARSARRPSCRRGSTWAASRLGEDRPDRRRPVLGARDRPGLQVRQDGASPRRRSTRSCACRSRCTCSCCATSSGSSRSAASTARSPASGTRAGSCARARRTICPGFVVDGLPGRGRVLARRSRPGKERAAALVERIRAGDVEHDPRGGFPCPTWCDLWSMCRVRRAMSSAAAPNTEQLAAIEAPGVVFVSAGARARERRRCSSSATCARSASAGSTSTRFSSSPTRSARPASCAPASARAARARPPRPRPLARRRLDLDHPRLLPPAAQGPSVRGRDRSALPRAGREPVARRPGRGLPAGADGVLRGRGRRAAATARDLRRARPAANGHRRLRDASFGRPRRSSSSCRGGRSFPSGSRSCVTPRSCLLDEGPHETVARVLELLDCRRLPPRNCSTSRATPPRAARASASRPTRRRARGSSGLRSTSSRGATATSCSSCCSPSPRPTGRPRTATRALDFEDLQLYARDLLRDNEEIRERERWRLRSIMVDEFQDTNRLQCELVDLLAGARPPGRSRAGRAGAELFFVGDEFQSIYRFRHADVEVFRERREQTGGVLALTENYRSRPEVLEVINHLFSADFGTSFQPLSAAGPLPRSRLRPRCRAARHRQVDLLGHRHPLAEGRGAARRAAAARDRRRGGGHARRDRPPLRGRHRRAAVRGGAARARPADLPRDRPRLLQPPAGRRPARLPAAAAEPLRRRGARDRARLAVRRRLQRRARAAAARRRAAPAVRRARARRCPRRSTSATRGSSGPSASATSGSPRAPARSRSSGYASRSCSSTTTTSPSSRSPTDGAATRTCASSPRLARSYEELRGRDIEGFVRFVREQDSVGAQRARGGRGGRRHRRHPPADHPRGQGARVQGRRRRRRRSRLACLARRGSLPAGRPPRLQGRAPGDRQAPADDRLRGGEGGGGGGRARRAPPPLLRGDDAGDRPADRVRLDRSAPRVGRRDADRLGARAPRSRTSSSARETPRSRSSVTTRGSSCGSTASGRRRPRPRASVGKTRKTQLSLFAAGEAVPLRIEVPPLPELEPVPAPPEYRIRRLSYSALALFERCSYRFYAERIAGMRPARRTGEGEPALAATEVGDAVHGLLERIDLAAPGVPDDFESLVRARYPFATDAELERIRELTAAYAASELAPPGSGAPRREGGAAVRVRARRRPLPRPHRRAARRRGSRPRHRLQDERAGRPRAGGRGRCGVPPPAARLRNRVPACRRRRSRGRAPVPGTRGRRRLRPLHPGPICRASRRSCPPRSRASRPAISARRPARWSARTARCWGSSARGRRCAATRASPPPR